MISLTAACPRVVGSSPSSTVQLAASGLIERSSLISIRLVSKSPGVCRCSIEYPSTRTEPIRPVSRRGAPWISGFTPTSTVALMSISFWARPRSSLLTSPLIGKRFPKRGRWIGRISPADSPSISPRPRVLWNLPTLRWWRATLVFEWRYEE